jgi:hypothetical protein
MNEPHGVAAEIMSNVLLTGLDNGGQPTAQPRDFQHISYASSTLWPIAPSSSLFSTQVPPGSCMIWTYITMYTTLANESSPSVNYGLNFDGTVFLAIQGASGNFISFSPAMLTQGLFNKPILLVFDPQTTPRLILAPAGSGQPVGNLRIEAAINGYLLPAGLAPIFRRYATKFLS